MAQAQPFKSAGQASVVLTSVSVATATAIGTDGENLLVYNGTTQAITFDVGVSVAVVASATSPYVLAAGARMLITVGRLNTGTPLFAAAFPLVTATGSVYFMRGDGMAY